MFKKQMSFDMGGNLADQELSDKSLHYKKQEIYNKKTPKLEKKDWDEMMNSGMFSAETKMMLQSEKTAIAKIALEKLNEWDQVTIYHVAATLNLSCLIAEDLFKKEEIDENDKYLLFNAVATHDWGKEFVPQDILNKKDKLDEQEFAAIKEHPTISAQLLKSKRHYTLADINIRHHMYQGASSYPNEDDIEEILPGHKKRIKSNQKIEKFAKIIAIIDKVDAMLTENRPYKTDMWLDEVKNEIKKDLANKEFDKLIDFAVDHWRELK